MQQEKTRKILFTILLCSLSALISISYNMDSNLNSSAFAQTYDSPTDPGASAVPTDNSTATPPSDNSTDLGSTAPTDIFANNMTDPLNQTDSGISNNTNANNTSSQGLTQSAIPEFGPVAQVVLIIGIFSLIMFRTKFSNIFKN